MRQAESLHNLRVPMLMPGLLVNTSPTDYAPMRAVHFARFEGDHWAPFGDLMARNN